MENLQKNKIYFGYPVRTGSDVEKEIDKGLLLLKSVKKKIISVFGSHTIKQDNPIYRHCEKTAFELGKKGYSIMTGGGPGIMKAANSGAYRAGVPSIGIKAKLLQKEQSVSGVHTHTLSLKYLFVRKFILAIKSEALVFYPGGFGTLDELFGFIVLSQTGMADKVPIICVNKKYWKGLFAWAKKEMLPRKLITKKDIKLIKFVDDTEEIIRIIVNK